MPAISFEQMWLDDLLSCDKQQTTRKHPTRIKVGDVANIYIAQRQRILDKPLRRMTPTGIDKMYERGYPMIPAFHQAAYPAHFLGAVRIDAITAIHPCNVSGEELEAWAWADGFKDVRSADAWFRQHHGFDWGDQVWDVISWHGWVERYFEAGELTMVVGD